MAIFQHEAHKTHYELLINAVPQDTLLIHGNLASNRWWYPSVQELRRLQGAERPTGRLCMAEWLGCGGSSPPRTIDDLQMPALARQYVELVRSLEMENVNVIGHSTGGPIALYAVLQAPQLFNKVILLDGVGPDGVKLAPEMLEAFAQMQRDRDFCSLIMSSTIQGVEATSAEFQAIVSDTFDRVDDKVWKGIPTVLSSLDARADWSRIEQAVLILQGEHDTIVDGEQARALHQVLRHSELRELDGQGHSCNIENPRRFAEIVNDYFYL
jgi:3-oxoadipate enol-lactonase